jgi:hypothetical protein
MDSGILMYFGTFGSNLFILLALLITGYLGIWKKIPEFIFLNFCIVLVLTIDAYVMTMLGLGDLIIFFIFIALDLKTLQEKELI